MFLPISAADQFCSDRYLPYHLSDRFLPLYVLVCDFLFFSISLFALKRPLNRHLKGTDILLPHILTWTTAIVRALHRRPDTDSRIPWSLIIEFFKTLIILRILINFAIFSNVLKFFLKTFQKSQAHRSVKQKFLNIWS